MNTKEIFNTLKNYPTKMKIIFYLLPLFVLLSCSQNQKADNLSIEVISINLDKKENEEMSEFIEKIELVPLHTDTNSIISTYKKIDYCDELDMFIILDKGKHPVNPVLI